MGTIDSHFALVGQRKMTWVLLRWLSLSVWGFVWGKGMCDAGNRAGDVVLRATVGRLVPCEVIPTLVRVQVSYHAVEYSCSQQL